MKPQKSESETHNDLKSSTYRAIKSLTGVSCVEGLDTLFKIITLVNLAKKGTNALVSRKISELTRWMLRDVIVKVNFKGITYSFQCPKGYDFNIYLNPYYHEYDVVSFASSVLQKGDVFIDVGAHGGLYTLLSGKIVGSRGKVIAIEPNPENLKFLRQNVILNKLKNIVIIPKAASNRRERINLYYQMKSTALTSAIEKDEGTSKIVEAETITIDEIADTYDSIKLLKVDTEGYDLKVLEGACYVLPKICYVVVESNKHDIRSLLCKLSFNLTLLLPSGYLLATNKNLQKINQV